MKKNIISIAFVLSIITPVVSFAALQGLTDLLTSATKLINLTIPIVFGIALIFFFWGMAQFILHADDKDAREEGKQRMLWGIVALFVIVSIYGILTFIGNTTGIKPSVGSGNPNCNVAESWTIPGC